MPSTSGTTVPLLTYVHTNPDELAVQPTPVPPLKAPPGISASRIAGSAESPESITTRTPFATGSSGGEKGNGTTISPLNVKLSSPGAVWSRPIFTLGFTAITGMVLVHGSHSSP